jgi:hypothetical protein
MPLLERLMIAAVAVLVAAVLIGWLKLDMARIAAANPPLPRGIQVLSIPSKGTAALHVGERGRP